MSQEARPELSVIIKTYDFILWLLPTIDKFPRVRKFTLGDQIEKTSLDTLRLLIRAKYRREARPVLEEANIGLNELRFLLRLAKDLHCLSIKSYGFASEQIDGIGRELGGWMKSYAGGGEGG